MEPARKTVQMIRIALLVSIALYVLIGERVGQTMVRAPNRNLYFVLTLVAITTVGMMFAVRRLFVLRAEATLAAQPEDTAALNRWRSGYIITYALSEAVAVFGLVLRILGCTLSQVAPFYLVGFVLMLLFGPRRPSRESGPAPKP
jgi:F0F1-type ATP synthase membrane subunit c/vacuolar-type H+-ATPase subunit K